MDNVTLDIGGNLFFVCKTREDALNKYKILAKQKITKVRLIYDLTNCGQLLKEMSSPTPFPEKSHFLIYSLDYCTTNIEYKIHDQIIIWDQSDLLVNGLKLCQICFVQDKVLSLVQNIAHMLSLKHKESLFTNPPHLTKHKRKRKLCVCGTSIPNFNLPGSTKAIWCKLCKSSEAVCVTDIMCECGLHSASFNVPGKTKAIWCLSCPGKSSEAVNVISKKCKCGVTQPRFSLPGSSKAIWCSKCKPSDAIDVKVRKCECGKKWPTFGFEGSKAIFCVECKDKLAINVKDKKCACKKRAYFGYPGQSKTCCFDCKKEGMIRRPRKFCIVKNCKESAIFGRLQPERCDFHKIEADLNLVEKPCKSCGLMNILDPNGNCQSCDPKKFQEYKLWKERQVVSFLKTQGIVLENNKVSNGVSCGKERCDIVIRLHDKVIIIEVDEDQHKTYQCLCEQTRMVNITQTFGGLPCFWIRFNPDSFKFKINDAEPQHILLKNRYATLLEWIRFAEKKEMTTLSEVVYLYFDECSSEKFCSEIFELPSI